MAFIHGAHIQIEALSHRYRAARTNALEDVSLTIEPGEFVALIGRSGCGKSTLLHIMAGLVMPTRGQVLIDGATVEGPSPEWVMMFQQPSLFPWMSVAQNVALGLVFNRRGHDAKRRVPELLELVQLSEFSDRNVQDLSGGQQQRVALARSLALKPKVLFLDEPFSALDAFTRASLQRDVRTIARELGITTVLVTHDVSEAALMAERAVIMTSNPGRIRRNVAIDRKAWDGGDAYQAERMSLMTAYEDVAGDSLQTSSLPPAASSTSSVIQRPPLEKTAVASMPVASVRRA
ncbi:MAG: ABC transporter ATP-binding protein [Hyphomicrobiaceae bacterium]|nr:ABC transporter ATP-binding protein [Hyphomicrobiaceae bacterium]